MFIWQCAVEGANWKQCYVTCHYSTLQHRGCRIILQETLWCHLYHTYHAYTHTIHTPYHTHAIHSLHHTHTIHTPLPHTYHAATFYGGQYRVNLRLEDRFLSVSLNFRTSHDTGVLFIARLKDNSGYFTLGLANRQLVATVKHNGNTQRLPVGSVNTSKWQTLNVHLPNQPFQSGPVMYIYLSLISMLSYV